MNIVGILASLSIISAMTTQVAKAAELDNTNTKTEFKIEQNIEIENGIAYFKGENNIPFNFEGYEPIKSEEELKNEKILSRWREKQEEKWKNLPVEEFVINASAYTAAADECGKNNGITSSGIKVKEKRTLACPPEFPFGAKIEIEGMGTYVCEDRGGAIKGNHFDIYMKTKKEAFAFGRKNLIAKVVQ